MDGDKDDENNHVKKVIKFRSIRFEVLNTGYISATLTKMADDIETQFGRSHLNCSDIALHRIEKVTVHYDKYNPTRAGSYIELPKWVSSKKLVLILKMKMTNVSNIVFNALFLKSMRKTILKD